MNTELYTANTTGNIIVSMYLLISIYIKFSIILIIIKHALYKVNYLEK